MVERVDVVVVGGGVVGCASALALARRGVSVVLAEALPGLALQASGTNSGILHTGFDAKPGEFETDLILRAAPLRDAALDALGVPVLRCGARMAPRDDRQRAAVDALQANAQANGVDVARDVDGALLVPGESVTDPVAFTLALAAAAQAAGARILVDAPVSVLSREADGGIVLSAGEHELSCAVLVNCAGLRADDLAAASGGPALRIRPRKGEFLVFDPPAGVALEQIVLPVPSARTKGVLVFPTLDGKIVCGPTAHDQNDKDDWSVERSGERDLLHKLVDAYPALAGASPIARYAGLRPAGVDCNYVIQAQPPGLVTVAAIRSTGLTASLGIAEYVCELVAGLGLPLGSPAPLTPGSPPPGLAFDGPWWARTAAFQADRAR